MFTDFYSASPENVRRQAKAIFVWYPKERAGLKMINDEDNLLTNGELIILRDFLRTSKHACLHIRNEHARGLKTKQVHNKQKNKRHLAPWLLWVPGIQKK